MQTLDKEQKNLMYLIIDEISKNKLADEFKLPVDWVGMWLFDYPDIVTNPMDLSTLKEKINTYAMVEDFLTDLLLIWDNCKLYNKLNTVRYKEYC